MDWNFLAQSIIAMLVITAPPDPVKVLLFNSIIDRNGTPRFAGALRVATIVFLVLGGSALVGSELLELLGIDLDAFTVVGGVIVAGMGFEMLYGGSTPKPQGQKAAVEGPTEDSGLLMPLAIPLIAGPGAIATAIAISTSNADDGPTSALIGAGAVALVAFVAFQFLGGVLAKASPGTAALLLRIGGMVLATIGVQMLMGGLKRFWAA